MQTSAKGFRLSVQHTRLWQQGQQGHRTVGVLLLDGRVDLKALHRGLQRVIAHQESWQAATSRLPGMEITPQAVPSEGLLDWHEVDIRFLSQEMQQQLLVQQLAQANNETLAWTQEALVHVSVLRCSDSSCQLALWMPAIWADEHGWQRLINQWCQEYAKEYAIDQYADEEHALKEGPRTPIEELLTQVWQDLLGQQPIGRDEDFFQLGGHSLLGRELMTRLCPIFDLDLTPLNLSETPTIAGLAQRIEQLQQGPHLRVLPPLEPIAREQPLPLSFAQQRLWFLEQLDPHSTTYHVPLAAQLSGQLQLPALAHSLTEIIQRHETLRTTFQEYDGLPVQVIRPFVGRELPVIDLTTLPKDLRQAALRHLRQQEAQLPFDLTKGPLLRMLLLRLAEDEHILLLTMHHIISDGRSTDVFMREFTHLYNAFVQGTPSSLAPLPIQYADYAAWQRQWLQGEVFEHQLTYWKEQLEGVEPLELPTDRPRPAIQTANGADYTFTFSVPLTEALKALSRQTDTTFFMTLLASFQVLLARYSGQSDIAVGTLVANRAKKETEGLIGFFVNALVMRCNLSGNPSFLQLLTQVRAMALNAYAHQDVPFEKVVEAIQPERDLSRSPIFQVLFLLQDGGHSDATLDGLTLRPLADEHTTAVEDIFLTMTETRQGLKGILRYNTDLFDRATIAISLSRWQHLLEGIVRNPSQRIAEHPLLTPEELQHVLFELNQTDTPYPLHSSVDALFQQQVALSPHHPAISCGDTVLSYQELDLRISNLAGHLRLQGIGPDELVGIYLERSVDLVLSILATWRAGGAYVPLDPAYPVQRFAFILLSSKIKVLITQASLHSTVPPSLSTILCAEACLIEPKGMLADEQAIYNPHHLAYVIYTSGSTGTPKGVMVHHQGMLNHLFAKIETLHITNQDVIAQTASQCFDISVWQCLASLLCGGQVSILPDEIAHDPRRLLAAVTAQQITILEVVPSLLQSMLDQVEGHVHGETGMRPHLTLRWLVVTGEALLRTTSQRWMRFYPDIPLINAYGPTECSDDVTQYEVTADSIERGASVPAGRALANTQMYVLDDYLLPVPTDVPGNIYVGGTGVGRGYYHDPVRTASVFIPDPFSSRPGSRLYRTGDIGRYLADGTIEFVSREDHQVKVRGYRIELGEVEAILHRHASVRESVVLTYETAGNMYLVAYVVPEAEQPIVARELRTYLSQHLPEYMVPSLIVKLKALPLLPNGKVNRRALPEPEIQSQGRWQQVRAPRTMVEEILAEVWSHVLQRERIGTNENFFEIGGHSLLATQIVSRVRQILHVALSIRNLFEYPTIAELAEQVERLRDGEHYREVPPIAPASREQDLPLSFAQQRLWFLGQLEPTSTNYVLSSSIHLYGPLDQDVLAQSITALIERHESLRTAFETSYGEPIQRLQPTPEFALPLVDLAWVELGQRERLVQDLARQEAQRSFDLSEGYLFRPMLLHLSNHEHVLLMTMHHIISDRWSIAILVRELKALYNAFVRGEPSPLIPLPVQYADYALWQREWLQGHILETHLAYWKKQLAGVELLDLPSDFPRPAVQSYRGEQLHWLVPETLWQQLERVCQHEGVTMVMTLLAAFQILLARYSGQQDIAVGTPIANRPRAEVEEVVGFFVNTLVIRSNLSGAPTFRELLHQVREVTLEAYAHQDAPFEKVIEALQPDRNLGRSPLFQAMFALQQTPFSRGDELMGVTARAMPKQHVTAPFDLSLVFSETEHGIQCTFEYSTDLFREETIRRWIGHWETLLRGITADSGQLIQRLPLLSTAEHQHMLVDWNRTATAEAPTRCWHELFQQQAESRLDAVALVYQEQQLTYAELNARANQLARHLRLLGVTHEVLVGICVEPSLEQIIGQLAILKAGGAFLPLDPAYPPDRLEYMINEAQLSVILTQSHVEPLLSSFAGQALCFETLLPWIKQQSSEPLPSDCQPEQLAYVIYTSGSTGKPKGVQITHRGIGNVSFAQQQTFGLTPHSHALQYFSASFDASIFETMMGLLTGAKLFLNPRERNVPGPELATVLHEQAITHLTITPSALAAVPEEDYSHLQTIVVAGEACSAELVARWAAHRSFFNAYGPTETTIWASVIRCTIERQNPSIGHPISNTQIYLLDHALQPVPIGIPGEISIGTIGLARGYMKSPEITAERFIPHPWSTEPGLRLYKTGDLARYRADGTIEFLGRTDHQVKVRGHRIELGEIETVLAQHPTVREVFLSVHEGLIGMKRLVAYLVFEPGQGISGAELRIFLQGKLPEYMIPSFFLPLDALPLTPNGKIDRRALPLPPLSAMEPDRPRIHPANETESQLSEIWKDLLQLESISTNWNFFAVGGHSLLATQLRSRIQESFLVTLPLRTFFEISTIAGIAALIEQKRVIAHGSNQQAIATAQLAYWKERLAGVEPLELPTDFPRSAVQTFHRAQWQWSIPPSLPQQLHELSQREGVTLFMTLLAAFQVLLARYSHRYDIAVGTPLANRKQSETDGLLGFLANTLVMRSQFSGTSSFRDVVRKVRATILEASLHQDVPLQQIVDALHPKRDLSHSPLFQVMFSFQNEMQTVEEENLHLLKGQAMRTEDPIAGVDLTLTITQRHQELQCCFEYNPNLFAESTIQRWTDQWQNLLNGLVLHPEHAISRLPLFSSEELAKLLPHARQESANSIWQTPVHTLISQQAQLRPDAVALLDSQQQVTYAMLEACATRLAHSLYRLGVGPEVLVGICLERRIELVIGKLAVLKAGGAYLPLDPASAPERLSYMLQDSGAAVLLTQTSLQPLLDAFPGPLLCLDTLWMTLTQAPIRQMALPQDCGPQQSAYVIYPTDSTEQPKGVTLPHSGLSNVVHWHIQNVALTEQDRSSHLADLSSDACVWELWPPLVAGSCLHLAEERIRLWPEGLHDWLLQQAITIGFASIPVTESLLQLSWPEKMPLRLLLTRGEQLHNYPSLPFQLINHYGPAENSVVALTTTILPRTDPSAEKQAVLGKAIEGVQSYILDEHLELVPFGMVGELYLGGKGLARGYLRRAEETAERFVPHPYSQDPGARLYKTGDRVSYRPDGQVDFHGRSE